jgi:UDP-N-acetylglucosamine 1-carboxyvinyltransferase
MDRLLISGGRALRGVVPISGSKNATLPLMAAACLAESPTTLYNTPSLVDLETMLRVLMYCGCGVKRLPTQITLSPDTFGCYEVPYDVVRKMRASVYMLGPMLARHGRARVSLPGGCAIGTRPIDIHLRGFKALGAKIDVSGGYVNAAAPRLRGCEMDLRGANGTSVGATANVLMAAAMAQGESVIHGAAREPEIVELVNFLRAMGAQIEGEGTERLQIQGTDRLYGVRYTVAPDRIEAGTYMAAAMATAGSIVVQGVRREHLCGIVSTLERAGAVIGDVDGGLSCAAGELRPINVVTETHPGFPTDMQAQLMAVLATVPGRSHIRETIYPQRFMHVCELQRMGANIEQGTGEATVQGVERLSGAPVMASDLRASAALIIAALVAEGETLIQRIYHLDRGYERLEEKLTMLGAKVERLTELKEEKKVVPVELLRDGTNDAEIDVEQAARDAASDSRADGSTGA